MSSENGSLIRNWKYESCERIYRIATLVRSLEHTRHNWTWNEWPDSFLTSSALYAQFTSRASYPVSISVSIFFVLYLSFPFLCAHFHFGRLIEMQHWNIQSDRATSDNVHLMRVCRAQLQLNGLNMKWKFFSMNNKTGERERERSIFGTRRNHLIVHQKRRNKRKTRRDFHHWAISISFSLYINKYSRRSSQEFIRKKRNDLLQQHSTCCCCSYYLRSRGILGQRVGQ